MLKSLKRAVVPSLFSRSRFEVSDQTKEYLIKQNRPVIFSHHQLKNGPGLVIMFEQLIKMAKLHIMFVNSMLLAPQWHGLASDNWQLTISKIYKTSKRCWISKVVCVVVEHNIYNIPSQNINGKFCWDNFFVLDKGRTFLQK